MKFQNIKVGMKVARKSDGRTVVVEKVDLPLGNLNVLVYCKTGYSLIYSWLNHNDLRKIK